MPAKKTTPKTTAKAPKEPRENSLGAPRKKAHDVIRAMVDFALANGGRYPVWDSFAAAQKLPVATVQRLSETTNYIRSYSAAVHRKISTLDLIAGFSLRSNALATLTAIMSDPDSPASTKIKAAEVLLKEASASIARLQPSNPESIVDAATRLARDGILPMDSALALESGIYATVESMRRGGGDAGLTSLDLTFIELEIEPLDDEPEGDGLDVDC